MNKKNLVQHLAEKIAEELKAITQAALATYDIATHEDNKPENKYDTRGLEASYLAGAQAQRVSEMKEVLAIFQNLPIQHFNLSSRIGLTALVEVLLNDKASFVLIMPKGGGQSAIFEGQTVQVITPESPLGQALLNRSVGDWVDVVLGPQRKEYKIISIC